MITWFHIYPALSIPFWLISAIAALPSATFNGHTYSGMRFSEWLLNHFVVPVMPNMWLDPLIGWFMQASKLDAWLLMALVALNLNAIILPILFWMAKLLIQLGSWSSSKSLDLKVNANRNFRQSERIK